jgi:hypothetical protein
LKIYFDTEFSSLWDPQLISVGMVAEDGKECYVELLHDTRRNSRFTSQVVMPLLLVRPVTRDAAADTVRAFLRQHDAPELVCDFIGDWWLLLELIPDLADLALPRCALHGAPDLAYTDPRQRHNALADAKALMASKPQIQQGTD